MSFQKRDKNPRCTEKYFYNFDYETNKKCIISYVDYTCCTLVSEDIYMYISLALLKKGLILSSKSLNTSRVRASR
jgi:hypothetical protein